MLTLERVDVSRAHGVTLIKLCDERGSMSMQLPADPNEARRVLDEAISKLTEARAELAHAVVSDLPKNPG